MIMDWNTKFAWYSIYLVYCIISLGKSGVNVMVELIQTNFVVFSVMPQN